MNVTSESVASGVESIKTGFKSIFDGFKDVFKGIFDFFKELINSFKNLFSSAEADIRRAGEELGNQAAQGIQGVNEAVNEAAEGIKDAVDGAAEGLNNAAGDTVNGEPNGAPARQETEGANADETAQPAPAASSSQTGATGVSAETPYFCQYDNELYAGSSCQNTSIAMTLAKYGWKGNPDQITKSYGKDMAQTPAGLETVFNATAEKAGLKVRVKSHDAGTMELVNKLLAEGKPVIAHGWFTKSGHVVTITGFDGQNYTVNDPAGKWNGQYKGGYSSESGKGVKYSKEAMIDALVENGEVWCHEVYNTGEQVAG